MVPSRALPSAMRDGTLACREMRTRLAIYDALLSLPVMANVPAPWNDDSVNHLAGSARWKATSWGAMRITTCRPAGFKPPVPWLREKTAATHQLERSVLHLYRTRDGSRIRFTLEYSDGGFHNTSGIARKTAGNRWWVSSARLKLVKLASRRAEHARCYFVAWP